MTRAGQEADRPRSGPACFATTHWSVVLAAADPASSQAAAALEKLCRTYWYPLYAFVRRSGHGHEDAQDLTQEFFARLLAKDYLARADPDKGRFRSFLLAGIKNLLCDARDRAHRLKRGGGRRMISFDEQEAEHRYGLEQAEELTPERLFERSWAATLLADAARRLRDEYLAAGQGELYEQLTEFRLDAAEQRAYGEVANQLGMSESAVKSAIRRLRQRHQALVREAIAQTVEDPAEVDAEIRHLLQVLA
jgi:RNA polymerase sigma factor (sigma-70 family)